MFIIIGFLFSFFFTFKMSLHLHQNKKNQIQPWVLCIIQVFTCTSNTQSVQNQKASRLNNKNIQQTPHLAVLQRPTVSSLATIHTFYIISWHTQERFCEVNFYTFFLQNFHDDILCETWIFFFSLGCKWTFQFKII